MTRLPTFVRESLELGELDEPDVAALAEVLAYYALAVEAPAPERLRERLLTSLRGGAERYAPFWQRLGELFELPLERVRSVLAELDAPARWHAAPIAGMRLFHLEPGPRLAAADAGIVSLEPGTAFPEHMHRGLERVLVLSGGYVDSTGAEFGPGALHEMPVGSSHAYRVLDAEPCVFAVVLHEGIEIDGRPFPPR